MSAEPRFIEEDKPADGHRMPRKKEEAIMRFPVLEDYLSRLPKVASAGQRIWLCEDGRARGKFFNCTLTSVFQPVRRIDSHEIIAYEAFVQSYSEADNGLRCGSCWSEQPAMMNRLNWTGCAGCCMC